jgi:FkbM family methyltransferase
MLQVQRNGKTFNIARHNPFWDVYPNWEKEVSHFMEDHCQKDKITLDIGAWNGVHSFYMSYFSKKIYAIEPDPTAYREMLDNYECNPNISNMVPLQCAISDTSGTIKIMTGGDSLSSILENVQSIHKNSTLVDVPCFTLKDFLAHHTLDISEIGFIKMDIEGAEKLCSPNMEWFFKEYQGAIHLSIHPGFITVKDVTEINCIMNKYFKKVPNGWVR